MFKNYAQLYYSFVIVFIFFVLVFIAVHPNTNSTIKSIKIGGVELKLELADDKASQEKGLSGREFLAEDTGMLFVFPKPDKYYFWMKGMNFPIDMIWLNANNQIVYIKREAQPESFLETYGPEQESLYVLEVVAGFSDKHNLKDGDTVEFVK